MIDQIENGEAGGSVRAKINASIDASNTFIGVTEKVVAYDTEFFSNLSSQFGYQLSGRSKIVSPGDMIRVIGIGSAYRVADPSASDASLDYTGSGGVKLYVLPGPDGKWSALAFGAPTGGVTDARAVWQVAINAVAAAGGGTLTGNGQTYAIDSANGLVVNGNNVFIENVTFVRTNSANTGWTLRFATTQDTLGGGVRDAVFVGLPTLAACAGLSMGGGGTGFRASNYALDNIEARSHGQYGVGIGNGDDWKISNIRVLDHGLTVGAISSCMGFYLFPSGSTVSSGGQLNNVYSEISAASQANASANHAAIKLQMHNQLTANGLIGIGGSEMCLSVDSIGGTISNVVLTPQGNNSGLSVGNQNVAHSHSGQVFTIDSVEILGSGTNSLTIVGLAPLTVASVDTVDSTITSAAHGLVINTPVTYVTTGEQIGGLTPEALYYVINPTTDTFQLATARDGTAIALTSAGSGTQQIQPIKLAGCQLRNIRGPRAALLNRGAFKRCTFENWVFDSIALDPTVAGVTAPACENTENRIINVVARPTLSSHRFAIRTSDSVIDSSGMVPAIGANVGAVPQIIGRRNRVSNPLGGYTAVQSNLSALVDGAGVSLNIGINSTSGVAMGDLMLPAANRSLSGMLMTAHVNSSTAVGLRFQNETGATVDLDTTRFAARRVRDEEIRRVATRASVQFQATNLADGAGVAQTVTVPGAQLGDVAVAAWGATVASTMLFAYVSAPDTVTVRIQNESGGAASAVTATADLRACVLRDEAADFVNAVAYDPPSLADAAGVTTTMTVLGASVGDFVAVSFSLDLQGLLVSAEVSANDTVSVRFQNETGGAVDLGAGVLKALVFVAA